VLFFYSVSKLDPQVNPRGSDLVCFLSQSPTKEAPGSILPVPPLLYLASIANLLFFSQILDFYFAFLLFPRE
jgi:hypothetical protein